MASQNRSHALKKHVYMYDNISLYACAIKQSIRFNIITLNG